MSFRRFAAVTIPLLGLLGCSKKVPGPKPLYAIVRFENLSGDPSLDWIGRAATELLSSSLSTAMDGVVLTPSSFARVAKALGPRPATAPGISAQRQEAVAAGANHIVSGYIEQVGGTLRLHAADEDLTSGKITRVVSGSGSQPVAALMALAKQLSPTAKPFATGDSEALRLYSAALESTPATGTGLLEQALRKDPNFGPAWVLLAAIKVAGSDAAGARETIAAARTHNLTELDKASLDVQTASLTGNPQAKTAALKKLTALTPGDTTLLQAVADSETKAGAFVDAAADWRRLAELLPADADAWNQLGYNQSWAGNYAAAVVAHQQYARLRPNEANPLDSLGDVQFMNRKYAEAAKSYLAANAKNPGFERYLDLYKAAWAKFRAGDKAGADKAFEQFRATRANPNNPGLVLLQADWLYRTGRKDEAVKLLRDSTTEGSNPVVKANAYSQLAVWDLVAGNRAAAAKDSVAAGQPTTPVAVIIRIATMPSASASEWASRVNSMLAAPNLAGIRRLALGYALILDGKTAASIPVWEEVARTSAATDFALQSMVQIVKGTKPKLALIPNPDAVNQFAVLYGDL